MTEFSEPTFFLKRREREAPEPKASPTIKHTKTAARNPFFAITASIVSRSHDSSFKNDESSATDPTTSSSSRENQQQQRPKLQRTELNTDEHSSHRTATAAAAEEEATGGSRRRRREVEDDDGVRESGIRFFASSTKKTSRGSDACNR